MHPIAQDIILKELRTIYWCALKSRKWHVALQALEQQARYMGLFEKQYAPPQRDSKKRVSGLTHPPPSG